jgi:PhnB protein
MSNAPHPSDPSVMNGVIPYLAMAGRAAEACDFYARAFAATDMGRMPFPDGKPGLIHAQIAINGGALMMTDHGCMNPDGTMQAGISTGFGHLQLVVGDGRAWWQRAVAAGCKVLAPYERQFWGDDWGLLEDPFGLKWAVLQPGAQPAA